MTGKRRRLFETRWFLRFLTWIWPLGFVAVLAGWFVTEVGRQPWIVYEVMRTEDAVTQASGVWVTFGLILALYAVLGVALVLTLRGMARRWRSQGELQETDVPYGPAPEVPR